MIRWRRFVGRSASDAEFRTWGQEYGLALSAFGWLQTGDTGQIDWGTVAAPNSTNQQRGYEIWRANDSLAGSAPFYVKLFFGSAGGSQRPCHWVQFGTGSNGSGTLTNGSYTMQVSGNSNDSIATTYLFVGDAGRFAVCWDPAYNDATSGAQTWFGWERSSRFGVYNGDGAVLIGPYPYGVGPYANPHRWGQVARSNPSPGLNAWGGLMSYGAGIAEGHWRDGNIVYPYFYNFDNGFLQGESISVVLVPKSATCLGVVHSLVHLGQARPYLVAKQISVAGTDGAGTLGRPAFLYE